MSSKFIVFRCVNCGTPATMELSMDTYLMSSPPKWYEYYAPNKKRGEEALILCTKKCFKEHVQML